jgi:hypothetical protein
MESLSGAVEPPSPDNPFALRLSRFDPKPTSHAHTLPEQVVDAPPDHIHDHPKRERKYSTAYGQWCL